jgi:hypothetical protein
MSIKRGTIAHIASGRFSIAAAIIHAIGVDTRPCTCHPDDNPPVPCPRKFALTECRAAALSEASNASAPSKSPKETRDAVIEEAALSKARSAGPSKDERDAVIAEVRAALNERHTLTGHVSYLTVVKILDALKHSPKAGQEQHPSQSSEKET